MVWPHAIFTRHHAYPRVQQRFGSAGAHQTRTDRPGHGVHTPSNTCTFCYIAARAHRHTEAAKSRTRRRTPRRTRPHALHGLPGDDRRRCCHARAACPPPRGSTAARSCLHTRVEAVRRAPSGRNRSPNGQDDDHDLGTDATEDANEVRNTAQQRNEHRAGERDNSQQSHAGVQRCLPAPAADAPGACGGRPAPSC